MDSDTLVQRQRQDRLVWIAFALLCVVVLALGLVFADRHGRTSAYGTLVSDARAQAERNAVLLRSVLEKQRAVPFVLSQDSEVRLALENPNAETLKPLNQKLEELAVGTRASVIYLVDIKGLAIAASNWRDDKSFVGNVYSFREYFTGALARGSAEHYALGTVSLRPGLYMSRRIDGRHGPLGVVVVKVEFEDVEQDWARTGNQTYAIDQRGILLVTSLPEWRFWSTRALPDTEAQTIRESLQFGDAPLKELPVTTVEELTPQASIVSATLPNETKPARFMRFEVPVESVTWTLHAMVPLTPAVQAAIQESRMRTLIVSVPLLSLLALFLRRRQRAAMRIAANEAARRELESRVELRTQDLSRARDRLEEEIKEHHNTAQNLQSVQHELVQANRLAILGQVAAGVAHEINQPVATIRAYADNARTFLERGQAERAVDNLSFIAGLTERIGGITDELRTFSRKGRGVAEPTALRDVIEGALLLLASRLRYGREQLRIAMPPDRLMVHGNRVRLEQVLINLLQNALEAVEGTADGRVRVDWAETANTVTLTVSDTGPGIRPDIRAALFTPFNTSKEGGLGLGLIISKDIVADYGGRLDVDSDSGGTRFTIELKKG
uniref:sensor histidine kinase n=1 Tax=Rhizobium sp. CFBP 8762 TaxID=2775279 RepID=UPI001FD1DCD5|nr:ATP-binding protein [Rhizobium sp. CFBP 8762]